ncbi:hypothetical protein [Candidatus Thiosymbion oneisti]|uniref:hypothetical protein n=1 Tax=Candidatus Thiosymbion oneisti TaxID=589554 RepID=UPI000B7F3C04|nr:hypothetical protein [Candidatus Thiosymbion oneisti]
MDLRLNPFYKKSLLLAIVLGPIVWLVFTEDGQRRTDLAMLYLFGKDELNLAIEKLHSGMTEAQFRGLFPDLELTCDEGANSFGDRLCSAEIGAFSAVPARAFTLFLQGARLRAAKLNYRRAYHGTLRRQLTRRLGKPTRRLPPGPADIQGPLTWAVDDGFLLLSYQEPQSDQEAALIWLSEAAMQQRLRAADG